MIGSWLTVEEDDDDEPSFDEEGRPDLWLWPFLENGAPNPQYMKAYSQSDIGTKIRVFFNGREVDPAQFQIYFSSNHTIFVSFGGHVRGFTDPRMGGVPAAEVVFEFNGDVRMAETFAGGIGALNENV